MCKAGSRGRGEPAIGVKGAGEGPPEPAAQIDTITKLEVGRIADCELRKAGVDLTQRATVQAVIDQLDELVSQMEVEAAKITG